MALEKILFIGLAVAAAIMLTSFVDGGGREISGASKDFRGAVERIQSLGSGG